MPRTSVVDHVECGLPGLDRFPRPGELLDAERAFARAAGGGGRGGGMSVAEAAELGAVSGRRA